MQPLSAEIPTLVLASASPRRRELLPALGLPFSVRPADTDETPPADLPAAAAVGVIAARKADAALALAPPGAIVLAADTIVVLDGRVLGKPAGAAEAAAMLTALAGREHHVCTAVVVARADQRQAVTARTAVWLRSYLPAEIAASIALGTPFDKAGAYAIQDPVLHPAARCEGCWCNVMGLPLWTVYHLLCALPVAAPRPPDATYARCAACPLRHRGG